MWLAELILGEDHWEMTVELMIVGTREEAYHLARAATDQKFVRVRGRPALEVTLNGKVHQYYDGDVTILEVSQQKRAQMGKPIDVTKSGSVEKITKALETMDPDYVIGCEDMVASELTLESFLTERGEGYRPDSLAFGGQELTPDNCRHILGDAGGVRFRAIDDPNVVTHIREAQAFLGDVDSKATPFPGYCTMFNFCPSCEHKLDKEANRQQFDSLVDKLGGY